ncbi:MAG: diguanylate cyclase [Planctomycetota bacterium]|jgi:diguanylate cyclase (GGDEF)-like protein|nr:diguanylate cyclase [Planctomycetota bacterium]
MDRATVGAAVDALFLYLGNILYSPKEAKLDLAALPEEFREFGKGLLFFTHMLNEFRHFALELGNGNLSVTPPSAENELAAPLKNLHASLKHLTWQSKQVARGDYKQKVDFMGDFADAFNTMIRQLDERSASLMAEIESGKQKTLALEKNIAFLKTVTEWVEQWIVVVDRETGGTLFSNGTATAAMEKNSALADRLREWLAREAAGEWEKMENPGRETENLQLAEGGRLWYFSIVKYRLSWLGRDAVVFLITDMSEERKYIQELESVAYQDTLTRVNSRHYGMRVFNEWIDSHLEFCLCLIDMDSLKYVNDTFGHLAGDEYITTVAKTLSAFSPDARVARLGGDEFILLQRGWTEAMVLDRMAALREELVLQDTGLEHYYTRSISYGVVHVGMDNAVPASDLLGLADERMYRFKREHRKERRQTVLLAAKAIRPGLQPAAGPVIEATARPPSPETDDPSITVLPFLTEHLVGIKTSTTLNNARLDCPALLESFLHSRMRLCPMNREARSYGVVFITNFVTGNFDYWAAMPLAGRLQPPPGLSRLEIPAGLYALHQVKTNIDFTDVYDYLYGPWISSLKDYRLDLTRPSFELYTDESHDKGFVTIHIPVLPVK